MDKKRLMLIGIRRKGEKKFTITAANSPLHQIEKQNLQNQINLNHLSTPDCSPVDQIQE